MGGQITYAGARKYPLTPLTENFVLDHSDFVELSSCAKTACKKKLFRSPIAKPTKPRTSTLVPPYLGEGLANQRNGPRAWRWAGGRGVTLRPKREFRFLGFYLPQTSKGGVCVRYVLNNESSSCELVRYDPSIPNVLINALVRRVSVFIFDFFFFWCPFRLSFLTCSLLTLMV